MSKGLRRRLKEVDRAEIEALLLEDREIFEHLAATRMLRKRETGMRLR